jgi:hypothetical protein
VNRIQSVSSIVLVSLAVCGCSMKWNVKTESSPGSADIQITTSGKSSVTSTSGSGSITGPGGLNSILNRTKSDHGNGLRYSSRSIDGVESKLETLPDVVFSKGKLAKWPANAVVRIGEKRNGVFKDAELRPQGSQMKVWMKRGSAFEPGSAEDQKWADDLLASFNLDDTPDSETKKEAAKFKVDDPRFAEKLAALHYTKAVTELVTEKAKAPSLNTREQIALIDLVFKKVSYDKNQKAILLELIHRKDLSKEATTHILDNLDKVHYKADQKLLQRALFDKASAR